MQLPQKKLTNIYQQQCESTFAEFYFVSTNKPLYKRYENRIFFILTAIILLIKT